MLEELRKLLRHATVFGLGAVLGKAVGFLMIPFYTHYLVPTEYGTLELLDLTTSVVGLILGAWVTGPVLRFYYDSDEQRERNRVISTALIGTIVIAFCVTCGGYLFAPQISSLVLKSSALFRYIRIVSVTLFFSCLFSVGFSYLRARQQSTVLVVTDLVGLVISLSLNIYLIAFRGLGVTGMLIGSLMGVSVVSISIAFYTFRQVGFNFDITKFRTLFAFGAPLFFNSVAAFVLNFSDRFFLQHFSTLAAVGVYALGYKFAYMLSFLIVQPFMLIWGARAFEVAKQDRGNEYIGRIVEYFALVLIAGALGLSLIVREVVAVVSASPFHDAYRVVPIVAIGYVFQGLALYFQAGLLIEKKSGKVGLIGIASIVVNLALNFFLIRRYGMMGAACATALSFVFLALATFAISRQVYRAPYRISRLAKPITVAVLVYLLSTQISISSTASSVIAKLALFLLFPLALLAMRFFDPAEILAMRRLRQSIFKRRHLAAATASD